jgi:hypothetical protein
MRNKQITKISPYFWIIIASTSIGLSSCSVSGKYYSKYDSREHDSKRYGTRMFNSIEISEDSSYILSEWNYLHSDLRHYMHEKSGNWTSKGDTVTIDGKKYLHNNRTLTDIKSGVKWRKRLIIFVRKE